MKKIIFVMLIVLCFFQIIVCADGVDEVLDSNMKENIENTFEDAGLEYNALDIIDKLNHGNFDIKFDSIWKYIKTNFSNSFKENFGFVSSVFVLVMLSALIENIQISTKNDPLIKMVVTCAVILGLINVTYEIAEYSIEIIDRLILFINSLMPTLMTLIATSGKIGTSGMLNPIMLGVSSVISLIIKSFIVPLCMIGLVLKLTGDVTSKTYLTNFGNQIYKLLKWTMGLVFTIYVGIIGVVGVATPKVDEITLKTTKYAVGNFIPYVGGMVADSVDLLLACSSVVKNSVGIAGLIGIFSIIALPCLKVAVKVISVNLLAVVVSPVAGKEVISSINNISACVGILLSMNVVVAIMYILSVTVIIFIGGA